MDEEVTASLHKHRRTTLERLEKYISDTYFTDVNLRGKLYPFKKNISSMDVFSCCEILIKILIVQPHISSIQNQIVWESH